MSTAETVLNEVLEAFDFGAPVVGAMRFGCGHINDTFCVHTQPADYPCRTFILQRMSAAAFKHPDQLMSNIIGGSASNSLLNSLLREKNGWVYGVESSYSQYTESGIMTISLGCERSNLEKCLDAIWKVIRKMQDEEYSSVKLKAAKKQFLGQLAISSDNGESQCLSMGKSLVSLGTIFTDRQNIEAIEAVTSEGIRNAALRIFNPESTSSLIFL